MASYQKFNAFVENQTISKIDWDADVFKIMLCNTAPVATNSIKSDLTEIAAGNGYSAGGMTTTITVTRTGGTVKAVGTSVSVTASGGTIGPFRYAVLYDDTLAAPVKPLVAFWDYGASITLNSGENFAGTIDGTNGIWQLT